MNAHSVCATFAILSTLLLQSVNANQANTPKNADPRATAIATEFRKRLERQGGALMDLTLQGDIVTAKWISIRCDYLESEVTDLLLSVNRGMSSTPRSIKGHRSCANKINTYLLSEAQFQRYRRGEIGDLEVLKGIN